MAFFKRALLVWLCACSLSPSLASHDDCGLEPPGTPAWPALPVRADQVPFRRGEPPLVQRVPRPSRSRSLLASGDVRKRSGALQGKTVYLSAGHGFTWTDTQNAWRTQRGNNNNIVEDLVSTETASQFILPLLMNAGAVVRGVRELDMNAEMALVDDGDGRYQEQGPASEFASGPAGWGPIPAVVSDSTQLFATGTTRTLKAAGSATASASWTPEIPADGRYNVYVSFASGPDRVRDAHYVVKHPGGSSELRVNQQRHGGTWVLLGSWFFRAGQNPELGSVRVLNDSSNPAGRLISLDAVRFGGGRALNYDKNQASQPDAGRSSSTRPRCEEAGRYGAQFLGAVRDVFDNPSLTDRDDDIGSRPRFAAWDLADGEDAVYVAWHTNATGNGSPASGTETFVYGPDAPYQCTTPTPTAGSLELGNAVHSELVSDLRKGWDPAWPDRQFRCAYFGELSPANNPKMPAILVEVAFHETPPDSESLKEARFRYVAARGIVQGIIKYFAAKDGVQAILPPEPPVALSAVNRGNGEVELRWARPPLDSSGLAGDDATAFRVFSSADGLAWDDGVDVAETRWVAKLTPGSVRYYRVASLNAGGESFPSQTVGTRAAAGPARVLIVNGFTRLDAAMNLSENLSSFSLATVQRLRATRMNDGSYVRRYGEAVEVFFDSATSDAVSTGAVSLDGYAVVGWFTGRGSAGGGALAKPEQQLLRAFVANGGSLLFSGTTAAEALSGGSAEEVLFRDEVLRIGAPGATVPFSGLQGVEDSILRGVAGFALDDGSQGTYASGPLREVTANVSTSAIARYADGGVAAVFSSPDAGGKVIFLGFPFETVVSASSRAELMGRFLGQLAPSLRSPEDGGIFLPDGGTPGPVTLPAAEDPIGQVAAGCGCGAGRGAGLMLFALSALSLLQLRRPRRK